MTVVIFILCGIFVGVLVIVVVFNILCPLLYCVAFCVLVLVILAVWDILCPWLLLYCVAFLSVCCLLWLCATFCDGSVLVIVRALSVTHPSAKGFLLRGESPHQIYNAGPPI